MLRDIRFYHLERQAIEIALPKLMERVLDQGLKAVVKVPDEATMALLDTALWASEPTAFLPHGTQDSGNSGHQPIYLTTGDTRPNDAAILVLVNGATAPADLDQYDRCLYMFDGLDTGVVAQARTDWKALKEKAETVSYWRQKREGGWEQKA